MMFLCFISDPKERSLFDSLSSEEKKTYHSQSPKTYLPSMSVLDLREAEERGGKSLHYEYILNRVSKLLTLESGTEANNAFALYLIFHEFGHYNEFELFDRNVYEMRKRDFPYYEEVAENAKLIKIMFDHKSKLNECEQSIILKHHEAYYSMPSERNANSYADENFVKYYKLLKW